MTETTSALRATVLNGFGDARLAPQQWDDLLRRGETDTVFLTREWQTAWWESFGRGKLLLVLAERDGAPVALAPLFADAGMVYFIGSGGSDYLDFIGDVGGDGEAVLDALLVEARAHTPAFLGFVFYHVPEQSRTGARLRAAAARLSLACFDQGELPAPAMDLAGQPEAAVRATRKKSLVRHENGFRRDGGIEVRHFRGTDQILPHLDALFEQHVARWAATDSPSLFLDPAQRAFYRRLTQLAGPAGWLRFTRIDWHGRPIALHLGFCRRGEYLWYKPTFDVELARSSPGEVLLRQLLLAALDEHARTFDFGLGDEPFKRRFATHVNVVRTWGLYPPEVVETRRLPA